LKCRVTFSNRQMPAASRKAAGTGCFGLGAEGRFAGLLYQLGITADASLRAQEMFMEIDIQHLVSCVTQRNVYPAM
jgi:hypothetical protein